MTCTDSGSVCVSAIARSSADSGSGLCSAIARSSAVAQCVPVVTRVFMARAILSCARVFSVNFLMIQTVLISLVAYYFNLAWPCFPPYL